MQPEKEPDPKDQGLPASSADKRFAPRRSGRVPAIMYVDTEDDGTPCVIKDMSATGARVQVLDKWTHPFKSTRGHQDRVWLHVRAERMRYDCRIVRREGDEFGLKFVAPPMPIAKGLR